MKEFAERLTLLHHLELPACSRIGMYSGRSLENECFRGHRRTRFWQDLECPLSGPIPLRALRGETVGDRTIEPHVNSIVVFSILSRVVGKNHSIS